MKDLEAILKSYKIHFDHSVDCRECAYKNIIDRMCFQTLNNDIYESLKALKEENEGLKERIKVVIECKDELDKYNTELTTDNNSIITENEKLKEKLKDVTECKNELLEENQKLLRMLEENGLLEIADDLERV